MAGQIAEAYVQIIPTTDGIASGISQALGGEGEKGGKLFSGGFVKTAGTVLKTIGIAALAKGTFDLAKTALEAGGAVQQSFGGLETIYGDAAEGAKNFARQAASAGIDMNTYAEQAVSMGAALKQAYGGDTTAAMNAANTAIMDMTDNAAKMGTDIGSLQSAYQGFAKQNYTMLDNLKLGYGGTKSEMERLLADAQAITGVEYNIDNLGDVYEAIHVIQGELGLTGVAAEEASTTLTGAANAVKASWKNVLADMVLGNDVTASLDSLKTSITNFINNAAPMITNFAAQAPYVLVDVIKAIAPVLWKAGKAMITSLIDIIADAAAPLLAAAKNLWSRIVTAFTETAANIKSSVKTGISNAIESIKSFAGSALAAAKTLAQNIVDGIKSAITNVANAAKQIGTSIVNGVKSFASALVSAGKNLILGLAQGITAGISNAISAVKNGIKAVIAEAKRILGIASPSKVFAQIGEYITLGLAEGIEEDTRPVTDAIDNVAALTTQGMTNALAVNAALGVATDSEATGDLQTLISVVNALSAKIDNIRVYLDGDRVVGGIVERMDNALGDRALLVGRGTA